MIRFTDVQLYHWVASLLWPLTRVLGLIGSAPLFSQANVPVAEKIGLGMLLTLVMAPNLPAMPDIDPASLPGLMILTQQLMIGLIMGFIMNIIFMAIDLTATLGSLTMGLGFASFYDPRTQGQSSAINQLFSIMTILVFFQINGHLLLIAALADSFTLLPIGQWPSHDMLWQLANWSGILFTAGLQLSLPIVTALLITNLTLGILTRAAPQLNLFGIGFPVTLGVGFVMLLLSLDYLARPLQNLLMQGLTYTRQIWIHA